MKGSVGARSASWALGTWASVKLVYIYIWRAAVSQPRPPSAPFSPVPSPPGAAPPTPQAKKREREDSLKAAATKKLRKDRYVKQGLAEKKRPGGGGLGGGGGDDMMS